MKKHSQPDPELEALLSGLVDNVLEESERERLMDRLRNEPEARRFYLNYAMLDSALAWDYAAASVEEEEKVVSVTTAMRAS
ncbi:MAG: hypothetical protein AAGH89_18625, partial [Verrucomicrobiota bacterium]